MAFSTLTFNKTWTITPGVDSFSTYESNETQVRADIQKLHNDTQTFLNNTLIPQIETALAGKQASVTASGVLKGNGSGTVSAATAADIPGFAVTTSAPTAANTDGLKVAVLTSEPATKYSGWLYIITEA